MPVFLATIKGKNRLTLRLELVQSTQRLKVLDIVEIYSDSAKSGTNTDREAFQRMIKDSEEHKFKYLLIHKIDRFAREKYDSVVYKRRLKIRGIT